jgi:hypothetical protein
LLLGAAVWHALKSSGPHPRVGLDGDELSHRGLLLGLACLAPLLNIRQEIRHNQKAIRRNSEVNRHAKHQVR